MKAVEEKFSKIIHVKFEKFCFFCFVARGHYKLDCGTFGVKYFSLESIFLCGTFNEAQRDRHLTLTGYFLGFMKNVAK